MTRARYSLNGACAAAALVFPEPVFPEPVSPEGVVPEPVSAGGVQATAITPTRTTTTPTAAINTTVGRLIAHRSLPTTAATTLLPITVLYPFSRGQKVEESPLPLRYH